MTWYIAAADERVRVGASVCGTGTLRSHLAERSLDGHCDCMYFTNYYGWDLADLAALIAPRQTATRLAATVAARAVRTMSSLPTGPFRLLEELSRTNEFVGIRSVLQAHASTGSA